MPRRSTFTVDASEVQGNEGATATFSSLTVREWKDYRSVDDVNDITLVQSHLVSWTGFVDDEGNELPSPADEPEILDLLYMHEQRALARLLWQGPDGANAKN
jgi:hypothetical protein